MDGRLNQLKGAPAEGHFCRRGELGNQWGQLGGQQAEEQQAEDQEAEGSAT